MNDAIFQVSAFALALLAFYPLRLLGIREDLRRQRGHAPNARWWLPATPPLGALALVLWLVQMWRNAGGQLVREPSSDGWFHEAWLTLAWVALIGLYFESERLMRWIDHHWETRQARRRDNQVPPDESEPPR